MAEVFEVKGRRGFREVEALEMIGQEIFEVGVTGF
jgi:hypothetical protein